jgi:hypothetical protein
MWQATASQPGADEHGEDGRAYALDDKCGNGEGLLEAVNNTLAPMTEVSEVAYVLVKPGMPLTYSIAAHSPIFHLQRESGMVVRHSVDNLPVAMFLDVPYATSTIDMQRGICWPS